MTRRARTDRPALSQQEDALRRAVLHRGGVWHPGCGWCWGSDDGTERVLSRIAEKGAAVRDGSTFTVEGDHDGRAD